MIVTDSSAHLSRSEAQRLGATVVPMSYMLPGQMPVSEGYLDELGEFESAITQNLEQLRTSQATYSAFLSTFSELADSGAQILCITISSRLSGTYGNARTAARDTDAENIAVVDSLTTSGGLYLLICAARRMIDQGTDLHDIARLLRQIRTRIHLTFSVDDIAPLRRSGRLGNVRMSISTILNIRPVLRCQDGCIISAGMVRGRNEQYRTLINSLPDGPCRCVVEGFCADDQEEQLSKRISALGHEVIRRKIGPVLATHLGVGCLGVSWLEE